MSPLKDGNHNVNDALREFQEQSEIPVTGVLDATTIREMKKPRCGVPDRDEEEFSKRGEIAVSKLQFVCFGTVTGQMVYFRVDSASI